MAFFEHLALWPILGRGGDMVVRSLETVMLLAILVFGVSKFIGSLRGKRE